MIKKILKALLLVFIAFVAFSFWMSPRLGGLITMGKEAPDSAISMLQFDTEPTKQYELNYEVHSSDSGLVVLRSTYQLDTIIKDCKTDFEKVVKIQSWVQSRWKHDGSNAPEKRDAMYILQEAEKGKRFRCVEYSLVANQCLQSLGFKVRNLGLMTKDISQVKSGGGHAVNEVYLEDIGKWVFIDPQFDVITVRNGIPLNAVELQQVIAGNTHFDILNPNQTITKEEYIKWIGPYLYYFYTSINGQRISVWDRIVGNKRQLLLLPVEAKKPRYFQKIFKLNNFHYTTSIGDFYPKD